jgi:hypothetical protein
MGSITPAPAAITPPPPRTLDDFADVMHPDKWGAGWTLVERTATTLRYEKNTPAQQGSCLIAAILLLLGLIPGVLYMVYARKPARLLRLTVTASPSGAILPSGDHEGVAIFNRFIGRKAPFPTGPALIVFVSALVLLLAISFSCSRP